MSDDGFHTTCTTCDAWLKVRDPSAIGQIFACPKCGSMVMVAAPEGWELDEPTTCVTTPDMESPTATVQATTAGQIIALAITAFGGFVLLTGLGAWVWSRSAPASTENRAALAEQVVQAAPEEVEIGAAAQTDVGLAVTDLSTEWVAVESGTPDQVRPVDEPFDLPTTASDDIFAAADAMEGEVSDPLEELDAGAIGRSTTKSSGTPDSTALSHLAHLLSGSPPNDPDRTVAHKPVVDKSREVTATLGTKISTGLEGQRANIAAQLEAPLRAARFENVPLTAFVRSMMQLSGVPIQIDPDALQQTTNSATSPVSLAAIETTVSDALQTALEPINLKPITGPNVVRITGLRTENAATVQTSFFLGDLQAGRGEDLDFSNLVATLIDPDTWARNGGMGRIEVKSNRLVISNSRLTAIRTLLFLEKLRSARGLRPRSRIPQHFVSLEPKWDHLNRYLSRSISLNAWRDAQFVQVIEDLESASGLTILLDWSSLLRNGITLQTPTAVFTRDVPTWEVLQQLASRFDLGVLPIDERTIQLCSNEALASRPYMEFYSFDQLGEGDMDQVERLMLEGSAALDPASETAIVVGDANLHLTLSR